MPTTATITFLLLSVSFAATHILAVEASLYWYHWWFDIMMHLWGGFLVAFAVLLACRCDVWRCRPQLWQVLLALGIITVSWEVFERLIGLYDPATYWRETIQDLLVGFIGGLIGYYTLRDATMS